MLYPFWPVLCGSISVGFFFRRLARESGEAKWWSGHDRISTARWTRHETMSEPCMLWMFVCYMYGRRDQDLSSRRRRIKDVIKIVPLASLYVLCCSISLFFYLFLLLLLILRSQKQCSSILYDNSLLQSDVRFNHLFNSWSLIKFEQNSIQSIVDMRPPWGWNPCHYELWR